MRMGHRLHQPGPCYLRYWLKNSTSNLLLAERMGHRLHQPGPCYLRHWLKNIMYSKLVVGSEDGSSAASAQTLLLKALAQEHCFIQRWLNNLKA